MEPKKGTAPRSGPPTVLPTASGPTTVEVNKDHYVKVEDALNTIRGHPVFKGVEKADAVGINKKAGKLSGYKDPFNNQKYNDAMQSAGMYEASCNLFWCNALFSATPGVPILELGISRLMEHHFSEPSPFPFPLIIAVESVSQQPWNHKGGLQRVSPEEVHHAFLLAVARDIVGNVETAKLELWRTVALTTTMRFEVIANDDDIFWRGIQLRELIVTEHKALTRTAFARIWEVARMKERLEGKSKSKLSAQKLAEEWRSKVMMSADSDEMSDAFIDASLTVFARLLTIPSAKDLIVWCERQYGHSGPLNSVWKLQSIINKARDPPRIQWTVEALVDGFRTQNIDLGEMSIRQLSGVKKKKLTGLLDVVLFKKDVLDQWLEHQLRTLLVPESVCKVLREKLGSYTSYRAHVTPYADAPGDGSWKRGWQPSAHLILALVEEMVYGYEFDGVYKTALKSGKGAGDVWEYTQVKERVTEIEEALTKEKNAASASSQQATSATSNATSGPSGASAGSSAAAEHTDGPDDDNRGEYFRILAEKMVKGHVSLAPEPNSEAPSSHGFSERPFAQNIFHNLRLDTERVCVRVHVCDRLPL